jgi:hypothetical protein
MRRGFENFNLHNPFFYNTSWINHRRRKISLQPIKQPQYIDILPKYTHCRVCDKQEN